MKKYDDSIVLNIDRLLITCMTVNESPDEVEHQAAYSSIVLTLKT